MDSNFELYKRITDDRTFGDALKDFLFDHYLRAHRQAEELIKRGESKTFNPNQRCAGTCGRTAKTIRRSRIPCSRRSPLSSTRRAATC